MISAINNSLEAPVSASRRAHQSSNMKDKAGQVDTSTSEKIVKRIPCEGYVLQIAEDQESSLKRSEIMEVKSECTSIFHLILECAFYRLECASPYPVRPY
jgi:hypothetical protein